jgi:acyl-coenzyme A thioesterase PaaI-like protein
MARDPAFEPRVRESFAKQEFMRTLGATLGTVAPGVVEIAMRPGPAISQQHGFVHAGAVSAIADTAAGYAALSLMPRGTGVDHGVDQSPGASGGRSRCRAREGGESRTHPDPGASGGVRGAWRRGEADCAAHRDADDQRGARRRSRLKRGEDPGPGQPAHVPNVMYSYQRSVTLSSGATPRVNGSLRFYAT